MCISCFTLHVKPHDEHEVHSQAFECSMKRNQKDKRKQLKGLRLEGSSAVAPFLGFSSVYVKAFMIFVALLLNMYQWAVLMGTEDYIFACVLLFFEMLLLHVVFAGGGPLSPIEEITHSAGLGIPTAWFCHLMDHKRGVTDVAMFLLSIYKVPFSSHNGSTAWPGVASIFMSSYFIAGYLLEKLDCCKADEKVRSQTDSRRCPQRGARWCDGKCSICQSEQTCCA